MYEWWLDKIYLEPRHKILTRINPGCLYEKENYKTLDEQLLFATKYIYAFLEYKKILDKYLSSKIHFYEAR
jgi:hypothetical protein